LLLSDFHEDSRERRRQEKADAYVPVAARIPVYRCLKCGCPIEESLHYGSVWVFDRGGDALHVCKPTLNEMMAKIHRELRRNDDLS